MSEMESKKRTVDESARLTGTIARTKIKPPASP